MSARARESPDTAAVFAATTLGHPAPTAAPGGGEDDVLEEGLECTYTDAQSGETCTVKILKVSHDDQPPYYSVRMPDGKERSTVHGRLSRQVASPPPSESEASDPATRATRHSAGTAAWPCSRKREQRAQSVPRVNGFPFNPYSEENAELEKDKLHFFELHDQNSRVRFDQIRRDGGILGHLAATEAIPKRTKIKEITWHVTSYDQLKFKMFDTMGLTVCEGYVKQPAYGGKRRWHAVVKKLHNTDLPASQGSTLFSPPLYEAISMATAFGIWNDPENETIKALYPEMSNGRPRDAERELQRGMAHNERRQRPPMTNEPAPDAADAGIGDMPVPSMDELAAPEPTGIAPPLADAVVARPERGDLVRPSTTPSAISMPQGDAATAHVFKPFDTEKRKGGGMEVRAGKGPGIGVMYPLRTPSVDPNEHAMLVVRATIDSQPVKVTPSAEVGDITGFKRFNVALYGSHATATPAATLNVTPVIYPSTDPTRVVEYLHHKSVPVVGTPWTIPEVENSVVTATDVANLGDEIVPFDESLTQAIEAGIGKLLTERDFAVLMA